MGEKGCEIGTPGIGDIAYVKDLQTEEIVSTTFRCSQFGIGHHQKSMIGWVRKSTDINKIEKNCGTFTAAYMQKSLICKSRLYAKVAYVQKSLIDDLHATSRRPCWWNLNKRISLTSFVCGTNMAAKPLPSESQGIGYKSSICKNRLYPKVAYILKSLTRYMQGRLYAKVA